MKHYYLAMKISAMMPLKYTLHATKRNIARVTMEGERASSCLTWKFNLVTHKQTNTFAHYQHVHSVCTQINPFELKFRANNEPVEKTLTKSLVDFIRSTKNKRWLKTYCVNRNSVALARVVHWNNSHIYFHICNTFFVTISANSIAPNRLEHANEIHILFVRCC